MIHRACACGSLVVMDVVSLVPSLTETLVAWGIPPIACTRFCEQPDLRHVGGTKDPDVASIASMHPDLVVLDAEENRREDHDALVALGVPVHVLHIRSVDDVAAQLPALARVLGRSWSLPMPPERAATRRRAFVPIWKRPWIGLGAPTYGASLLGLLGIDGVCATDGPYPAVELAEVAARRPDLVIAPSEPYPFAERHRAQLEAVAPVVFVDGRDLFWWGARTSAALGRLAAALDVPGRRPDGPRAAPV
jgi:ABC-type Fe3+-hydroxamate transport system substrate-binding protein